MGAAAQAAVHADYPAIESAANHTLEDLSAGPAFNQLMAELQGEGLARALGAHFDMPLETLPTTITVRKYCERTDGNIHTDHKSKLLTVLLYFNPEWPSPEGRLRFLRSPDNLDDYAAEVVPVAGTLIAFRRTDHSWHGHSRFVGERRMVQVNYLDASPWALLRQRASRLSTHFMKEVLHIR
ncbi:MAG: 2OG-Fe(II) oxygenase [Gammaproteobacteria bacterium]|nr:2OG-Fe(II) oxygenase [Gammaproteobacteria bacterium]